MTELNEHFNREASNNNGSDFLFWMIFFMLLQSAHRNQFAEAGTHHRPPPTFLFG